ncbi:hypothetical protein ACNQ62_07430 [Sulfitobacter sp. SBS6]|uniref:hypothetical protein n=1 Tax=Sulfitobacter sp. SBS6 TaxID=3401755 RepID=UPI003AABE8F0
MAEPGWTAAELTALGAVLSGTGAVIGAVAVIVAAVLASNTFDGWRRQKLSERRIDQAERILTAAYNARRALGYVRSPLMEAHELRAAEEHLNAKGFWSTVDADRKQRLISAQGHYNRLNAVLDERRAVEECLPMARALFGEQVEKALELLNRQFHLVSIAVDANSEDGNDPDFARTLREELSSSSGRDRPNRMNVLIEEQVKLIEDFLVPVLRLEAK